MEDDLLPVELGQETAPMAGVLGLNHTRLDTGLGGLVVEHAGGGQDEAGTSSEVEDDTRRTDPELRGAMGGGGGGY